MWRRPFTLLTFPQKFNNVNFNLWLKKGCPSKQISLLCDFAFSMWCKKLLDAMKLYLNSQDNITYFVLYNIKDSLHHLIKKYQMAKCFVNAIICVKWPLRISSLNCRNVCLTFHVRLLLPKDLKTIQQIRHRFIFNLYSYGRYFVFAEGHCCIFPYIPLKVVWSQAASSLWVSSMNSRCALLNLHRHRWS